MKAKLVLLAALCGVPALAFATDLPEIKAGLWEVEINLDGQSQGKIKQCVDTNTAKEMLNAGKKMFGDSCSDIKTSRDGDAYISSISCQIAGSKMDSTTTLKGDFNSAYTMETSTKSVPPMFGKSESLQKSEARWLSACEAGMRPGDTITAEGQKMNVLDMMKNAPDMSKLPKMQEKGGTIDLDKLKEQMPNIEEMQKSMQQGK